MRWKKKSEKVVVGSDFFFQETTTKVTLMTLKLALEPLFFFALEFLQNDRLNISSFCGIYFGITTTILRTLDSGTNIFCKGTLLSELETIIRPTTVSDLSFCNTCKCPWPFHRETEWMMTEEELSDKCWDTIKVMASSYQQPEQESEKKKKTVQWLLWWGVQIKR